jgi:hypothetical protein
VLENRVFGRIYKPKTEEARKGWRKWYKEGLHDKYLWVSMSISICDEKTT